MPRHKEFDPQEVLDEAMCLFWEKGYEATSMQDLVERLGINRFSIYSSFGSKHKLFLAAVDHYRHNYAAKLRAVLEDKSKGIQAIKDYFRKMESDLSTPEGRIGCLVQNSTLELAIWDQELEQRIRETNLSFEKAIRHALVRARRMGEISPGGNLRQRARFLFSVGQGMIVVGKGHGDAKMLHDIAQFACKLLDSL